MLKNYTRLALIHTGPYDMERYRAYSRETAARFGLRFEEIPGSSALIRRLLHGPWEDDSGSPSPFVVAPPGHTLTFADFKP
jgi:hypothetical protein